MPVISNLWVHGLASPGNSSPPFCGLVHFPAFALADRHNRDGYGLVAHAIDEPITELTQLDLVVIGHPVKSRCRYARSLKPFAQFLDELLADGGAELVPLLAG